MKCTPDLPRRMQKNVKDNVKVSGCPQGNDEWPSLVGVVPVPELLHTKSKKSQVPKGTKG